MFITSLDN